LACTWVLMLLQCAFTGKVKSKTLRSAMLDHFRKQQGAYGFDLWLPKSHHALHLPDMMDKFGFLLSTFVHERRHKIIKRHASPRTCTTSLEQGLLEEVTLQQLHDMADTETSESVSLGHQVQAKPEVVSSLNVMVPMLCAPGADVKTAREARIKYKRVMSGDVVLYRNAGQIVAGEVWCHVRINENIWTCLAPWEVLTRERLTWKCVVRCEPVLVRTANVIAPTIFTPVAEGSVATLLISELANMEIMGIDG